MYAKYKQTDFSVILHQFPLEKDQMSSCTRVQTLCFLVNDMCLC